MTLLQLIRHFFTWPCKQAQIALAVALCISIGFLSATFQVVAGASEGVLVRRTTLLVFDAEVSVAFYRDMLGFEVWHESDGKISGAGLPVIDAEVGEPTRFVIMKGRDPYVGMVGLLQYGHPKKHERLTDQPEMRAGDFILMIEVAGIDQVVARLKAKNYPIYKEPVTSHIKSVSEEWDAKVMYLLDPDGHMIELTERLN